MAYSKQNLTAVNTRTELENTYKRKSWLWGLVQFSQQVSQKSLGTDLVIVVDKKPRKIYLQVLGGKMKELR